MASPTCDTARRACCLLYTSDIAQAARTHGAGDGGVTQHGDERHGDAAHDTRPVSYTHLMRHGGAGGHEQMRVLGHDDVLIVEVERELEAVAKLGEVLQRAAEERHMACLLYTSRCV